MIMKYHRLSGTVLDMGCVMNWMVHKFQMSYMDTEQMWTAATNTCQVYWWMF